MLPEFREALRREIQIAFDLQAELAPVLQEFRESEIPQLFLKAVHQPENRYRHR